MGAVGDTPRRRTRARTWRRPLAGTPRDNPRVRRRSTDGRRWSSRRDSPFVEPARAGAVVDVEGRHGACAQWRRDPDGDRGHRDRDRQRLRPPVLRSSCRCCHASARGRRARRRPRPRAVCDAASATSAAPAPTAPARLHHRASRAVERSRRRPAARSAGRRRRGTRAGRTAHPRGRRAKCKPRGEWPRSSAVLHAPSTSAPSGAGAEDDARADDHDVHARPARKSAGNVSHVSRPRRRSGVPIHAFNGSTAKIVATSNTPSSATHRPVIARGIATARRVSSATADARRDCDHGPPQRAGRHQAGRIDGHDRPEQQRSQGPSDAVRAGCGCTPGAGAGAPQRRDR